MKRFKSILSILLCVTLLICYLPLFRVDVSAEQVSSKSSVVYVRSADDLIEIANNVNNGIRDYAGCVIILTADIDLNGKEFTPIGVKQSTPFRGSFNGNKHEIKGLNISKAAQSYTGLFGYVFSNSSHFQNVSLRGTITSSSDTVGCVIAYLYVEQNGTFVANNITNYCNITSKSSSRAGICGYIKSAGNCNIEINGCKNYGDLNAYSYVGTYNIGGIVASIAAENSDVYNIYRCLGSSNLYGTVAGGYSCGNIGGLVGYATGGTYEIRQCYVSGAIQGKAYYTNIGGFIGKIIPYSLTISNSRVDSSIVSNGANSDSSAGGLIGGWANDYYNSAESVWVVENCLILASISTKNAAGFVKCGFNTSSTSLSFIKINNSYFDSTILSIDSNNLKSWMGLLQGGNNKITTNINNSAGYPSRSLKNSTTLYLTWDFTNIWSFDENGYPTLNCFIDKYSENQAFINSQSSEYSYLMGESWKNAGMENINEYLMTFPSISKAVLDSYNSNQEFIDSIAGWKFMEYMFETGEAVNDALNMKAYYSAILLSLIDSEIMDENYIKNIEESSKFEYAKILSKVTDIIKTCDGIDHEKLLSNGTCTIEEITVLNNKINSLDNVSSKISGLGKFLSTGKTINDSINLCINYYNVCNTSKHITNVLRKVKSNSTNIFLSSAIDDIVNATENAFDYVSSGFLKGTANLVKDYGISKINDALELAYNSNPITQGALLGYKIGKPLSNCFFSTDLIISNYFEFRALYEIEKAIKATVKDFETDFYNKTDEDSSLNYISAVSICFKTYYLSCDYATELAKYRNLCPFGYIFHNGKKNFEEALNRFNATRQELKKYESQVFRLWTYSLKDHYPEIYTEISPSLGNIYSTDLSTALVRLEYLSKTYTGEELKPNVTVSMGGAELFPDEYIVSYYNNINPGVATVKITAATGSIYTSGKTIDFVIKEKPFVKRLSIRGTISQISTLSLCDAETEQVENNNLLPDLCVYEEGEIVASVENGVITCDDLPIFTSENGVDILMQDKDYTVEINSNSEQVYNAEIQKLDEDLVPTELKNYNSLLLYDGVQCNINANAEDEVIVNNEILQADFSSADTTNKQQYNIYLDGCVAETLAYEDQRVDVVAKIPEGNIFVGWSIYPQISLSSNSSVSSFIMPDEDVYISANYVVNQSYFHLKNAIEEASEIKGNIYTKSSYDNLQSIIVECKNLLTYDISQELSQEMVSKLQNTINSLKMLDYSWVNNNLAFTEISVNVTDGISVECKVNKDKFSKTFKEPYVAFSFDGTTLYNADYTVVDNEYYVFEFKDIVFNQPITLASFKLYAKTEDDHYVSKTKELELVLPGDVCSDNNLNLNDLVTAAQYVAGWEVECNTDLVDVNNDATNDLSDVVLLSKYLAGWDNCTLSFTAFTTKAIIGGDVDIDMSE